MDSLRQEVSTTLRLSSECLPYRLKFLLLHGIDLRITKSEVRHHLHDSKGDNEPGEPLMISWHHVPWRKLPRSDPDRLFECVHVVVPAVTLLDVGGRELPRLLGCVEALQEPFSLLVARDVQKEFEDDRPLPREIVLEIGDVGEPFIPDSLAEVALGKLLLR